MDCLAAPGSKLIGKRVDQVQWSDEFHDVFTAAELVELLELEESVVLLVDDLPRDSLVYGHAAVLIRPQGYLDAGFEHVGGDAGADHGGHPEFPADRSHVAGGIARVGDDGRGVGHDADELGQIVAGHEDGTAGEIAKVLG